MVALIRITGGRHLLLVLLTLLILTTALQEGHLMASAARLLHWCSNKEPGIICGHPYQHGGGRP
uniref:Uncharacterized protein n=1 Tax=Oryza glaberrima TaxID=4538 RepID=I1R4Y1_ORYGL